MILRQVPRCCLDHLRRWWYHCTSSCGRQAVHVWWPNENAHGRLRYMYGTGTGIGADRQTRRTKRLPHTVRLAVCSVAES